MPWARNKSFRQKKRRRWRVFHPVISGECSELESCKAKGSGAGFGSFGGARSNVGSVKGQSKRRGGKALFLCLFVSKNGHNDYVIGEVCNE